MSHALLEPLLLLVIFLAVVSLVYEVTKKFKFPFVVALLILGFLVRGAAYLFELPLELSLSPDFIFFVLLPLLLFGSALHINLHQFKIQFKTISFLASFGLLVSVLVVGVLLSLLTELPFLVALLFGAMISATDPIAVLALFKSLGAPKRLGLIADGESMFNDATAVILFRVILAVIVGGMALSVSNVVGSLLSFIWVFVGSIAVGAVIGFIGSLVIEKIKDDAFVETTITVVLALGTFILAEDTFHLSGVIATVLAGMVVGNLGVTKISGGVIGFINDFWDYVGMMAIALVFFFAAFTIDFELLMDNLGVLVLVIGVVLVARAASVYSSMFITNRYEFFKTEPNVEWSWQHVLNWGGLRGVIPLVLVFALPEGFMFKEQLLVFTLGVLLFSLFVNGLSIAWLLRKLGVHLPDKSEKIIAEELNIFEIESVRKKLADLPDVSPEKKIIKGIEKRIKEQEEKHKQKLLSLASYNDLLKSLQVQALRIERKVANDLYKQGHISENVLFDFEAQLDLQTDAIEYPEVYQPRGTEAGGFVNTERSFRRRLRNLRERTQSWPLLSRLLKASREQLIEERYMMLKMRLLANEAVIDYLKRVAKILDSKQAKKALASVGTDYEKFVKNNKNELTHITESYAEIISNYQESVVDTALG